MPTYSGSAASKAAEENTYLRQRLADIHDEEEQNRNDAAAKENDRKEDTLEGSAVERMKSKNASLEDKIRNLEQQLSELKKCNVTELYQEYIRLNARRAYLSNENAGLQNILANQKPEVKKATRTINEQQQRRRDNEEQNASARADIAMFRERRDKLMKETSRLTRQEAKLQDELDELNASEHGDYEFEMRQLREDNDKRDELIAKLEAEIEDEEKNENDEEPGNNDVADELAQLREQYVELKEQLKQSQEPSPDP